MQHIHWLQNKITVLLTGPFLFPSLLCHLKDEKSSGSFPVEFFPSAIFIPNKWKLQTNIVSVLSIHHLNLYKGKETCICIVIRVVLFHFTILWLLQGKTHTREYIIDFTSWSISKYNGKNDTFAIGKQEFIKRQREKYNMTWDEVYHLN